MNFSENFDNLIPNKKITYKSNFGDVVNNISIFFFINTSE